MAPICSGTAARVLRVTSDDDACGIPGVRRLALEAAGVWRLALEAVNKLGEKEERLGRQVPPILEMVNKRGLDFFLEVDHDLVRGSGLWGGGRGGWLKRGAQAYAGMWHGARA